MTQSRAPEFSRVRVDAVGRVVIPADIRVELKIEPGQELILSRQPDGLCLQTFSQAVRAAQAAFAPYKKEGHSVVDELLRERREEARREYGE